MIYALVEASGLYEDYSEHTLGYFSDKEEANKKAKELNSILKDLKEKNKKLDYYDFVIEDSHGVHVEVLKPYTDDNKPSWAKDGYFDGVLKKNEVYCNHTYEVGAYCSECHWFDEKEKKCWY